MHRLEHANIANMLVTKVHCTPSASINIIISVGKRLGPTNTQVAQRSQLTFSSSKPKPG